MSNGSLFLIFYSTNTTCIVANHYKFTNIYQDLLINDVINGIVM